MSLSNKLVALRKDKKLTQADVAEKLNVSRQAISRWESGIVIPSPDNLKGLSSLYDVPVDYLLSKDTCEVQEESVQGNDSQPTPDKGKVFSKFHLACMLIIILLIAIVVAFFVSVGNEEENEVIPIEDINTGKWNDSGSENFHFGWSSEE